VNYGCVLCRKHHDQADGYGLIVGIFPSVRDAMSFAQTRESVPIDTWQSPKPGRRRWLAPGASITFVIEEHPIHKGIPAMSSAQFQEVAD
jgi:hypothetical protein